MGIAHLPGLAHTGLTELTARRDLSKLAVRAVRPRVPGPDAAVTRRVIDSLDGPVVLVGHCYGGAVITEAGTHEKRELRQERKIPYPQAGATKERRKQ